MEVPYYQIDCVFTQALVGISNEPGLQADGSVLEPPQCVDRYKLSKWCDKNCKFLGGNLDPETGEVAR